MRIAIALAAAIPLAACGGSGTGNQSTPSKTEIRDLDPNPPMSAGDIDSIVKETRDRDASRHGKAPAPAVDSASNTTN